MIRIILEDGTVPFVYHESKTPFRVAWYSAQYLLKAGGYVGKFRIETDTQYGEGEIKPRTRSQTV